MAGLLMIGSETKQPSANAELERLLLGKQRAVKSQSERITTSDNAWHAQDAPLTFAEG